MLKDSIFHNLGQFLGVRVFRIKNVLNHLRISVYHDENSVVCDFPIKKNNGKPVTKSIKISSHIFLIMAETSACYMAYDALFTFSDKRRTRQYTCE